MDTKELRREVEHAEYLAMHLSAHATLFDGYYDGDMGLDQAKLDPDTFYTSWNELFEKVDELYGALKGLVLKLYETKEVKEEKGNE